MVYFEPSYLEFFAQLAMNNNREWFNDHKNRFEEQVKTPFIRLVSDVYEALRPDFPGLQAEPKQMLFRIYRDTRFSKDKAPYKLHMSALIPRNGMNENGLYLEIGLDQVMLAGGCYMPDTVQLLRIRQAIVEEPEKFMQIVENPAFIQVCGGVQGEKNKKLPPEFKQLADQIPLLYNKQFYYSRVFAPPADVLLSPDLYAHIVETWRASSAFCHFVTQAAGEPASKQK
jgi:uncharacterized protein (TIGR02453 family)